MRILSLVEQLFFLLEKHKQPMHVGGLFLFDIPDNSDNHFVADLVRQMRSSTTPPTFPFDQVVHNQTFWKSADKVDIHYHFHHMVLPKPYSKQALYSYVSDVHANMLDKGYPLWECHIIEGIEADHVDVSAPSKPLHPNQLPINQAEPKPKSSQKPAPKKQFALYFKIHHALVDGVAAMRLVERSLSASQHEVMSLPPWALMRRDKKHLAALTPQKRSVSGIVKEQVGSIKPVFTELKNGLRQRTDPGHVSTLQAPSSLLNQRISNSRIFMAHTFHLSRFKSLAQRLDVSINDVALAVCSGALRSYLISENALPKEPLVAFVPVSLRKDQSASGNQTSLLLCDLGTDQASPKQRLQAIHDSMTIGKDKFGRLDQAQVINYSAITYAWEGVNLLTGAYPKKQAFNILISNVPGPKQQLYWDGAALSALYPASVVFDGQALNITFTSYLNQVHFGIIGCGKNLPNIQNLVPLLEQALLVLEADSKELSA